MTLNDESTPAREPGPPERTGQPRPPARHADLESVCHSVTELARAAARAPRRIVLRHGETTVEMEWPDPAAERAPGPPADPAASPAPSLAAVREAVDATAPASDLSYLHASTVGTFYHAAEPGATPFVSVGDLIRPGQPVGILEVMKMMTPVEAECGGRVVEVLVPDGGSVEYKQRLIALEPVASDGAG